MAIKTVRELRLLLQRAEREGCADWLVSVQQHSGEVGLARIEIKTDRQFSYGAKPEILKNWKRLILRCE